MNETKLSPEARKLYKLIEFDKDEILISEIRKHPFGLIVIYATGIIVALFFFIILVILPLSLSSDAQVGAFDDSTLRAGATFLGIILIVLTGIVMYIGAYLYKNNVMIVTSDKVAQVLNKTIFNRKVSQLSIGDIQDVTVTQIGLFARLFNFGTIVIETAGEQQNYTFTFTPDPYQSAKYIVGSHEENLKKYGN